MKTKNSLFVAIAFGASLGCGGSHISRPASSPSVTEEESAADDEPTEVERIEVESTAAPLGAGILFAREKLMAIRAGGAPKANLQVQTLPGPGTTKGLIDVATAVTAPFDPEQNKCELPEKLVRKLKREKNWAPPGLAGLVKNIRVKNLLRMDQASVAVLLHTVSYQEGTTAPRDLVITGAGTYSALDVASFVDSTRPEFVYTLDCSGYLSAAVSMAGGVATASMKTAAKSALNMKQSSFVARGAVFPPIFVALNPDIAPPRMVAALRSRDRLELLYALNAALPSGASAAGVISLPTLVDVVWTSNSGDSTFQGGGSLAATAGASFGVVSIGGGASAGLSLGKNSRFTDFDTYLVDAEVLPRKSVKVSELRAAIEQAVAGTAVSKSAQRVNANIEFTLDLPKQVCEATTWSIAKVGTGAAVSGTPNARFEPGQGCSMRVVAEPSEAVTSAGGFILVGQNGSLNMAVPVMLSSR